MAPDVVQSFLGLPVRVSWLPGRRSAPGRYESIGAVIVDIDGEIALTQTGLRLHIPSIFAISRLSQEVTRSDV
jgi:hypothetical protein